jgi:hypothetical protein
MPNPTPGENPTLRHSGLDPEFRSVFSGAKRRKNLIDELDSGLSQQ